PPCEDIRAPTTRMLCGPTGISGPEAGAFPLAGCLLEPYLGVADPLALLAGTPRRPVRPRRDDLVDLVVVGDDVSGGAGGTVRAPEMLIRVLCPRSSDSPRRIAGGPGPAPHA